MHTSMYRRRPIARFENQRVAVPVKFVAQGVEQGSRVLFGTIDWFPQASTLDTLVSGVCTFPDLAIIVFQPSERSMFLFRVFFVHGIICSRTDKMHPIL
jgi:hypothetical protein